jgi:hypothetical protein
MQCVIAQVTQLSNGTISTVIRQVQERQLLKGVNSNDYNVIRAVQRSLIDCTVKNKSRCSTWVDAVLVWADSVERGCTDPFQFRKY